LGRSAAARRARSQATAASIAGGYRSPFAHRSLATHGRSIDEILSSSLSHYDLMAQIENIASKWEPSTWTGFNSLRFDDNFLRHDLYAGLRPTYLTQYNGNTRSDVLRAAQLASVLGPAALRAGKTTFTLEALAAANGFGAHETHDALGDVRATTHMLRTIATRAPSTWELLSRLADKNAVFQLLREGEFVLAVEHFGTVIARPVIPVCPNPGYETDRCRL
jgi:exodeoxyribonuclease-1